MKQPKPELAEGEGPYRYEYKWSNIIGLAVLHALAVCTLFRVGEASVYLWIWGFGMGYLSGLGVTAGAHRLWAHRAYQCSRPLQLFLLFCYTLAGQNSLYDWVRDHRLHHQHSDCDADPHNARRGFFFSHVGWLMLKKHPSVIEKGRAVDMADIEGDPLLALYNRYYPLLRAVGLVLPGLVPPLLWGEDWAISVLGICFLRYAVTLNVTWSVNSAAHKWGDKPFNSEYFAAQNWFVSRVSMGEGWHNYHHAFPWDYRAQELGSPLSLTTRFLDLAAHLGLVYGRKQPSRELIRSVASKYGDGSWHPPHDTPLE